MTTSLNEYDATTSEWRELETYTPSPYLAPLSNQDNQIPTVPLLPISPEDAPGRNLLEDPEEMPPLISDSDSDSEEDNPDSEDEDEEDEDEDEEDEDEEDEDNSDAEDAEEQEQEQEPEPSSLSHTNSAYEVPSLVLFLSLLLFLLHLFNYGQLLLEKRQRESNPCFLMRF